MNRIGNLIFAITFFLGSSLYVLAQDSKPIISGLENDPCGNPLVVSTAYVLVEGKVLSVIDGETILVELTAKHRKRIKLIGVDAPDRNSSLGQSAKEYLTNLVLNKNAEISFVSFEDAKRKQIIAQVFVAGSKEPDVNREMLKAGLARYKNAGSSLDWYLTCHYKRVESEARAAKRGLWASAG